MVTRSSPDPSGIERLPALQGLGRSGVGLLQARVPVAQRLQRNLLSGDRADDVAARPQHMDLAVAVAHQGDLAGPAQILVEGVHAAKCSARSGGLEEIA